MTSKLYLEYHYTLIGVFIFHEFERRKIMKKLMVFVAFMAMLLSVRPVFSQQLVYIGVPQ